MANAFDEEEVLGRIPGAMERIFDVQIVGRRLLFGNNAVGQTGVVARQLGAKHVAVVADRGVAQVGLVERVVAPLREAGLEVSVFAEVEPEPSWRTALAAGRQLRQWGCDLVVGFGGGSAIDTSKGASVLAVTDELVGDYWDGDRWPEALPKILLPTTSGTGSELSTAAVFTDADGHKKAMRGQKLACAAAIVDPLLTVTLPPRATAESGVDGLIHAIEGYTSRRGSPFGDVFAERAIRLVGLYLRRACQQGDDVEARYGMSLASTMGGIAASMNGVGAVHALTYPVSTAVHISHGLANSIVLPHVIAHNLPANPAKYRQIAASLGEAVEDLPAMAGAQRAVAAVQRLQADLGLVTKLGAVGVKQEDFDAFVEFTFGYFKGNLEANARPVTVEDALGIYRAAW
ncbi:MAG: iron-containing alcohol dehydrogenase [Chloroflexota bacterium]